MALFANEPSHCHHFVRLQPLIETRKALPLVDWYVLLNIRHKLFFTWHFQPNIQSSVVWIRFSAFTASIHTIPNRRRKVFKQYQSLPEGLSSSGCGTVPLCGPGELCGAPTCSRKACHWTPPCLQDQILMQGFPLQRWSFLSSLMLSRERIHHGCAKYFNTFKGNLLIS